MDFIDKIQDLAVRIPKQLDHIQTEEATKNALVMPFIGTLGYNVFDPTEVTPELDADVGIKKGEKVDYAILHEGEPIILFECKSHKYDLDKAHASQLYRYFSVTQARFGVLTNGIIYRFFTDLEESNKMDSKPFFEFNLVEFRERHVQELKKFTESAFDLDSILTTASELKYTRAIKRVMAEQMQEPSDDFVRFFASQVYSGRLTQPVREQFAIITKKAIYQYINDRINQRLESALAGELVQPEGPEGAEIEAEAAEDEGPKIETTPEEKEAFYIVKSILREVVDADRVIMRDVQTYCGVLLDDNNRQPICRLRFNSAQKYLGLIDENKDEEKVPIDDLDEIYQYADRLRATPKYYE
jgi:hypothetical protein